jgi:CHRD domain
MSALRLMISVTAAAAVFVAGLWAGSGAAVEAGTAKDVALNATLRARAEVPKPTGVPARARGTFAATLVRRGAAGTLTWRLSFQALSGNAIAAHVHLGKAGRAGPVSAGLCGPCRSGARGSARVDARTVRALLAGGAYVNVHTRRNPAGEIRGQVERGATETSEPTTPTTTTTTTTGPGDPYP